MATGRSISCTSSKLNWSLEEENGLKRIASYTPHQHISFSNKERRAVVTARRQLLPTSPAVVVKVRGSENNSSLPSY